MKKFMELEIPLAINNKIKNSKKIVKVLGFSFLGLTFFVGMGLITIISIRATNEVKMRDYVFNLLSTDMSAFINPNKDEFKELSEIEIIKKLTDNNSIILEDYEALLTKYLIESKNINLEISEQIFKVYKLKLLEHASITIDEFNQWEKNNCSGLIGCDIRARFAARVALEEGLKEKLKEKEEIFLEALTNILDKSEKIEIKEEINKQNEIDKIQRISI